MWKNMHKKCKYYYFLLVRTSKLELTMTQFRTFGNTVSKQKKSETKRFHDDDWMAKFDFVHRTKKISFFTFDW